MKPKKLPRLWCALQGLLPLEACLAAQRGELAWPSEPTVRAEIGLAVAAPPPVTEQEAPSRQKGPR